MTTLKACVGAIAGGALYVGAANAASLEVVLQDVAARGGVLYVNVQTEDEFMGAGGFGEATPAPKAGDHRFAFEVAPGRYAVSVWHDADGDGVFDMDAYGAPAEGWAVSGEGPGMGPPVFGAAAVDVPVEGAKIAVRMAYPD